MQVRSVKTCFIHRATQRPVQSLSKQARMVDHFQALLRNVFLNFVWAAEGRAADGKGSHMRGQKKGGKKKEELGRSLKKVAQRGKPQQRIPETEKEAHALVSNLAIATRSLSASFFFRGVFSCVFFCFQQRMPDSVDPNTVMKSSTEPDNLADFLSTAELKNDDFESQKANTVVIESNAFVQVRHEPTAEQLAQQKEFWSSLRVPRRPKWTRDMDAEVLHQMERNSFLDWRRNLSQVEERDSITMTPFEKNLNVWRQLWRVVEMSDVLVQIVDARDPELFRCEDLERYTKEVGSSKLSLLLLNKADLLTVNQRRSWARYYESIGVKCFFFSAKQVEAPEPTAADSDEEEKSSYEELDARDVPGYEEEEESSEVMREEPGAATGGPEDIVGRRALIEMLQKMKGPEHEGKERLMVGFCGYPNVGKSSTINKLMGEKKVTVSATPGKTKHFQSLFLEENLCVLDW